MDLNIEFIDIYEIVRSIKDDNKLVVKEEIRDLVATKISRGIDFKGYEIKTSSKKYFNKITNTFDYHYYFICPECGKKSRKIYWVSQKEIGCRFCCRIYQRSRVVTKADKIIQIKKNLNELLLNKNIKRKKKNKISEKIIENYNSLDPSYKIAYNTFIFKELENWCLDTLIDKELSKDYKKAARDILEILRDAKKIMVRSGLAKSKNKELKI